MRILEKLTQLAAVAGFLIMVLGVAGASGAPQEAAAAAIGIGVAGIPYFFTSILQRGRILDRLQREPIIRD